MDLVFWAFNAFVLLAKATAVCPVAFGQVPNAIFVYLILQQRDRHQVAKQTLIEIERVLGLYDEGLYLVGKSLYPKDWQTAWLSDRSVTVYIAVIAALTVLVVAAVLARP